MDAVIFNEIFSLVAIAGVCIGAFGAYIYAINRITQDL